MLVVAVSATMTGSTRIPMSHIIAAEPAGTLQVWADKHRDGSSEGEVFIFRIRPFKVEEFKKKD